MGNRIKKENLDLLLGYNKKLSRSEISDILGVTDSLARTYRGILDNFDLIDAIKPKEENRVLVIGDLHEPFTLDGYLEFCVEIKNKYQCNKIMLIGDILDNNFSSYHEIDADGDSAGLELEKAKSKIALWYKAFPVADVCNGNHCLLPVRKAQSGGLSAQWIKSLSEVLNTPNWTYKEDFVIDGVMYTHGVGRQASQRAKNDMISIVQGHFHSKSYIDHFVGLSEHIWAMQVGCGIDRKSYAMAYGKHFDKPHINCGVVLENGTLPLLEYMNL